MIAFPDAERMTIEKKQFAIRSSIAWKTEWAKPAFRIQCVVCIAILSSFALGIGYFFDYIEARNGTELHDYVLELLTPHNLSWTIFFFLYLAVFLGIGANRANPRVILLAFETYCLVTLIRVASIYCIPLEPPVGYVPLKEPFVSLFTDDGRIISRDLFFSGHVSTVMSIFLAVPQRRLKIVLGAFVPVVATLLLIQHVHYTVDVLVAIPATWICSFVCRKVLIGSIPN